MHHLGAFFGHVVKAVRTDVAPRPVEVRRQTQVQSRDTPAGPVTLRRTIIEEVELPPAAPPAAAPHSLNKDNP